tara:strand:+ start:820 stop:1041 length:222 start_codon:yes stop_codon:yes gene_type:complete
MSLTYYQSYYFTEEEIKKVHYNLAIIADKIKQFDSKLNDPNKTLTSLEITKIMNNIDRLNMSKNCIKYYYNIC